ncbi:S-layer homology domain-containing protein [Cohnella cellulosilytica]|uniref:S-layer homology domain-containing protein n=1 Tax=Cohnella cellulosilytica TaxID=986710 RepID=A0ABW2F5M8_9BACL
MTRIKMRNRIAVFMLCISMLASSLGPVLASGSVPEDGSHWADKQLGAWSKKGYLPEDWGANVRPNEAVTRIEFISLINRSFELGEKADVAAVDIPPNTPAHEHVALAVGAGYLTGFADGSMRPSAELSRQEAAVMMARLLKLNDPSSAAALEAYADSANVPQWSKAAVGAVVAKGILVGFDDRSIRSSREVTRAEAVVMLERALRSRYAAVYDQPGLYGPANGTQTVKGDVWIEAEGVTLRNTVIEGNLLLGEGIGEGDATLDNVEVKGDTTVSGGGDNSIHFKDVIMVQIVVNKKTGEVRIVAQGRTQAKQVSVQSSARIDNSQANSGGFSNVSLTDKLPALSRVSLLGNFDRVDINAKSVSVDVPGGSIRNLSVSDQAGNTSLNLGRDAKVAELILKSAVKVLGSGQIEKAVLDEGAKETTFEIKPAATEGVGAPAPAAPAPASNSNSTPNPRPTPDPVQDPDTDPDTDPDDPNTDPDDANTDPDDPNTDPDDPNTDPDDPDTDPNPPSVTELVYEANVALGLAESVQLVLKARTNGAEAVDVTDAAESWSSSDETVATVSDTGQVTAIAYGSATVTATYEGLTAAYNVAVGKPNAVTNVWSAPDATGIGNNMLNPDEGVYVIRDDFDYLVVSFEQPVVAGGSVTVAGVPGAEFATIIYSQHVVIRHDEIPPGSYSLNITGLYLTGTPSLPLAPVTVKLRK